MQFSFDLGEVLGERAVTVVDGDSRLNFVGENVGINDLRKMDKSQKLSYIINEMGKASAKAQGLPRPITTSSKLKHSGHRAYLLKVNDGNDEHYEVVGFLKVGYKTLFLYDIQSQHHEVLPLCVLDFYVHESKQRQGYGRMIFEWMLEAENVQPQHIAIDRPSPKFLLFLAKHYSMTDRIAQLNNFVIFVDFFRDRLDNIHNIHNRRRYQNLPHLSKPFRSEMSSPSPLQAPLNFIKNNNLPKRRTQSNASKDRVQVITLDNLRTNEDADVPDVDKTGPPLLTRGSSHIPHHYKTILSSGVLYDNKTHSAQSLTTHIVKRPPSDRSLASNQVNTQQQCCGRLTRKDYNYDVGLARHYSHTRLW